MKASLRSELQKRLEILCRRVEMIPNYVNNDKSWAGKNHYTLDMIPPLEAEIEETRAAIKGIDDWKAAKKGKS